MNAVLKEKVEGSIKLLQSVAGVSDLPIEVAYSGGKDSDVILELARMAGINYRAIYKNTTIDPPGTIKHVLENGVEIFFPKKNFFQLVAENGFPNRYSRHCCRFLKEYKVLDKVIMGVRKCESTKRASRYKEPTSCRFYGSKKNYVEAVYPILDWLNQDVVDFIKERGIKIHPLYYREDGVIDPKRRLGCMCCPLASRKKRIESFLQYPGMVKAYCRAGQKFRDTHPAAKVVSLYDNVFDWFVRDVFYGTQVEWEQSRNGIFGKMDCKSFLENRFGINF